MPSAAYKSCLCGCGLPAPLASKTCSARGWVKGEPLRYRHGHGGRGDLPPSYREEDRGYETPCWIWQRAKGRVNGYGLVKINGITRGAHRAYYERYVGPIPNELEIDHLCRVRECVNPAHLEAVTHLENVRRGMAVGTKNPDRRLKQIPYRTFAVHLALATTALTTSEVADLAGVSPSFVRLIRRGERCALEERNFHASSYA